MKTAPRVDESGRRAQRLWAQMSILLQACDALDRGGEGGWSLIMTVERDGKAGG